MQSAHESGVADVRLTPRISAAAVQDAVAQCPSRIDSRASGIVVFHQGEFRKKQLRVCETPATTPKVIRLKPSTTDYATFAAMTDKVLGVTAPNGPRTKPNKRMLWLANSKF